jgi:hypothetical protein
MKAILSFFEEGKENRALQKRKDAAKKLILAYRYQAYPKFRNKEDKVLSLIQSVSLSSRMVITRDTQSGFQFLQEEIQSEFSSAGIQVTDLPLTLFYENVKGDHPFSSDASNIIKFIGLIKMKEGAKVLIDLLTLFLLEQELEKKFGWDSFKMLPYFSGSPEFKASGWALGQIGDPKAISILREVNKFFGKKSGGRSEEMLIPLCKLGCQDEIKQLKATIHSNPTNWLMIQIIEAQLYIPEIIEEATWISENSSDLVVVSNAKQILRESASIPPGS